MTSLLLAFFVLLATYMIADCAMERPVIALSLLDPVDLGRILLRLNFGISALMGCTGAGFEQFFGSGLGQAVTIGAMAAWLLVPLGLGVRRFGRKNF